MQAIGAISKDRKNSGQGYRFRGVDDALNAMHGPMVELGLSLSIQCHDVKTETLTEPIANGKTRFVYRVLLLMDVTFYAADGSSITHTGAGEGIDFASDKASNKAMSAAFKYAVFLGLCIPVDDDTLPDSDATSRKIEAGATVATPTTPVIPSLPELPAGTVPDAGPKINEASQKEIVALVQALDIPPEVIAQLWAKYGVKYLYDLSAKAGEEVIAKLKSMDLQAQASKVF